MPMPHISYWLPFTALDALQAYTAAHWKNECLPESKEDYSTKVRCSFVKGEKLHTLRPFLGGTCSKPKYTYELVVVDLEYPIWMKNSVSERLF